MNDSEGEKNKDFSLCSSEKRKVEKSFETFQSDRLSSTQEKSVSFISSKAVLDSGNDTVESQKDKICDDYESSESVKKKEQLPPPVKAKRAKKQKKIKSKKRISTCLAENKSKSSSSSSLLLHLIIFVSVLSTLLWFHIRLTYVEEKILWTNVILTPELPGDNLFQNPSSNEKLEQSSDTVKEEVETKIFTSNKTENVKEIPIRVKRRIDSTDQTSARPRSNFNNAHVEFINPNNPKMREELEKRGSAVDPNSANPNPEGSETDDWVWLTSYSRIPLVAIQEFCSATKDYCPPGLKGDRGEFGRPGPKGERGSQGDSGIRGHTGLPGLPGLRGPKGEPGPGTDGRDGLPGEPGLDGISGRNGLDGIPGIDGMDGRAGRDGRNGTDGTPGAVGPLGQTGPPGQRGLPGLRGPVGNPGTPGLDGTPGIQAYLFNNTKNQQQLLIPPSIIGSNTKMRPLVVQEGENVRLRCSSSGVPRPFIKWQRADESSIALGSWKASAVDGPVLNLTRVNRLHMGEYLCVADNGITPSAQRSYVVEVNFPPMIRIHSKMVGVSLGSIAMLDCYVEAFPMSINYWENSDGRLLEPSEKYQISVKESGKYKVHMMLNVTRVHQNDLGSYTCTSKNELGITKGVLTIYPIDPNQATPPPVSVHGKGIEIYGKIPPELVDLDDLCPSPPPCPDCPPRIETGKCRSGGFALLDMVGWEIVFLRNLSIPFPSNRTQDCVLSAVGKPVFNRYSSSPVGCWMKDPVPRSIFEGEKYWVTRSEDPYSLYEYLNKTTFSREIPSRNYTLPIPFKGNFHTVFNGSFYYAAESKDGSFTPRIVRLDLLTGRYHSDMELPYASFHADRLYSSNESWIDLASDENGLWAIHSIDGSNNTAIVKIHVDAENMTLVWGWNITISHVYAGDMFIICVVLYAVDSNTERDTKIRLALDLFRRTLLKVDLSFSNPFRHTSMVSYNPRTRELFTWDKGNQLIYPIKYTDMGYDTGKEDRNNRENEIVGFPITPPSPLISQ